MNDGIFYVVVFYFFLSLSELSSYEEDNNAYFSSKGNSSKATQYNW
jgi:hypothetical protein